MTPSQKLAALPVVGRVFNWGWRAALLAAFLSPFMVFFLSWWPEGRAVSLRLGNGYLTFWPGDLVLAVMVGAVAYLAAWLPATTGRWYQHRAWHWYWALAWSVAGLVIWWLERSFYTTSQLLSPSKIWHNMVPWGLLGYWLWAGGIPAVVHTTWRRFGPVFAKCVVLVGALTWFWFLWLDMTISAEERLRRYSIIHEPFDWGGWF